MSFDFVRSGPFLVGAGAFFIFASMVREALLSRQNEQYLRSRGAIEPGDDVWQAMRIVYPAAFVAMLVESAIHGGPRFDSFVLGLLLWNLAKGLKNWAIDSLGDRWSFRVLVVPGTVLTARGPYRWIRHPNYVAVVGEFVAAGVMLAAPVTCVFFTLAFAEILRRRIRVEERALGIRRA